MTKAIPNIPRRCRVDLYSTGEIAIRQAMIVVEKMGASVALTDAVVLLSKAKDRVADFVDGVGLPLVGTTDSNINTASPVEDVVEKVARAIWESETNAAVEYRDALWNKIHDSWECFIPDEDRALEPDEFCNPTGRSSYMNYARAALAAIGRT